MSPIKNSPILNFKEIFSKFVYINFKKSYKVKMEFRITEIIFAPLRPFQSYDIIPLLLSVESTPHEHFSNFSNYRRLNELLETNS